MRQGGSPDRGRGKGWGSTERAIELVAEILRAPDWDRVEADVLDRYEDEVLAIAVRLLGGPTSIGAPRAEIVALLRAQYRRHERRGNGRTGPAPVSAELALIAH